MDALPPNEPVSEEMHDFAEILARALMMVLHYLNRRYQLGLRLKEKE